MAEASFRRSPWTGSASPDELERWVRVAEETATLLQPGAEERDRTGALPTAAVEVLRRSGLVNLIVPSAAGGHNAHWESAFHVARVIARVDASLGQVLGYHYLNQACITFYGLDEARQLQWYEASAAGNWMWSDSFNPVSADLSLTVDPEQVGSGAANRTRYRLNGLKRFATGAAVADIVIAGALAQGGDFDGQSLVFALPHGREGIEYLDDWDNIGYRASASGSVRYNNVTVGADDIIGADTGEPFSSVVTPGVQLLFGNIYLAVAQGALDRAKELTLARKNSWFLSGVERYADDPIVHRVFGELVARTAAIEALADRLNRRYDEVIALGAATTADDRAELEVAIAALKVASTEVGLEVASRIFEVTGASTTTTRIDLDRFWRDIRTHSLHDPVDYKKIEVGAHFLNDTVQPISLYT